MPIISRVARAAMFAAILGGLASQLPAQTPCAPSAGNVRDAVTRCGSTTAYARGALVRAGISRRLDGIESVHANVPSAEVATHRLRHAAVGAGVGAVMGGASGAIAGAYIDRTRPGTVPARAILGLEGAGIGLVAGLVVGALWR